MIENQMLEPAKSGLHELVDLEFFDPRLRLDIRYSTGENFLGRPVYRLAKAFMQRPVAELLSRAQDRLERQGFGVLIFDAYRPWSVTKIFWDESDENARQFLADPERGSIHNRGCAIDCSLFSLATGREVRMPSGFDEMNERAYADYAGGTSEERAHRDRLIAAMHAEGFRVLPNEWWHFNGPGSDRYPILDYDFEELTKSVTRETSQSGSSSARS